MCSCVVQVIIQRHSSVVTSTNIGIGPVFPCVGSVEQAQVRDQPELHFTITESLYKVFVRGLIAIAKQMTRTISCCHDISPCSTPVRTSPW